MGWGEADYNMMNNSNIYLLSIAEDSVLSAHRRQLKDLVGTPRRMGWREEEEGRTSLFWWAWQALMGTGGAESDVKVGH